MAARTTKRRAVERAGRRRADSVLMGQPEAIAPFRPCAAERLATDDEVLEWTAVPVELRGWIATRPRACDAGDAMPIVDSLPAVTWRSETDGRATTLASRDARGVTLIVTAPGASPQSPVTVRVDADGVARDAVELTDAAAHHRCPALAGHHARAPPDASSRFARVRRRGSRRAAGERRSRRRGCRRHESPRFVPRAGARRIHRLYLPHTRPACTSASSGTTTRRSDSGRCRNSSPSGTVRGPCLLRPDVLSAARRLVRRGGVRNLRAQRVAAPCALDD